jgi:hypothetical protein
MEWFDERASLMALVEYCENFLDSSQGLLDDGFPKGEHSQGLLRTQMQKHAAELRSARQELEQHANYPGRDVIVIPWMRTGCHSECHQ